MGYSCAQHLDVIMDVIMSNIDTIGRNRDQFDEPSGQSFILDVFGAVKWPKSCSVTFLNQMMPIGNNVQ
jgi:hypothetical protein